MEQKHFFTSLKETRFNDERIKEILRQLNENSSAIIKNEIINHDIIFRLDKLVEDTVLMVETFKTLRQKQEDALF